ncbi:MAG: helix-turn-helix domain-containing protein [Planctomycetaceae bacterium]|nr:helix-turn-helix domain-containing protein [Planctomycetaceae bacterium]
MSLSPTLTIEDVAEIEGVCRDTVQTWIQRGELRAHNANKTASSRKPRWRITTESLQAFREARGNKPAELARMRRRRHVGAVRQYV